MKATKISYSPKTRTAYIHFDNGSKQAYCLSYFDTFYNPQHSNAEVEMNNAARKALDRKYKKD